MVAIGEIGLDYYYKDNPPRETQIEVFEKQIILADKLGLPLVIHIREAFKDAIDILTKHKDKLKCSGVVHCYSGSIETAKILLDLGLYISFNGVITFKNAKKNVEVLKTIPLDRILVETDAPYLSPEPFRGKLNEPKNVNLVVDKISEILQVDRQELVKIFNANAMRLFKKLKF
ncbi:MAG: TatD family hydrolase [Clostridia bacterium]|nr:TatD family hydrolase [Clostridia bacterium]